MLFTWIRAMDSSDNDSDLDQIHTIMAAFEEFDNTGDGDVLAPHLADDVVFMPPGSSPVQGKDEIVERYLEPFPEDMYEIEQQSEQLLVGDELAVNRASVVGHKDPTDGGDKEEVNHKGLDVLRREPDGSWKVVISMWNNES